ncbi:putative T7SS-secreted protein [Streptomyces sp. NPDC001889]
MGLGDAFKDLAGDVYDGVRGGIEKGGELVGEGIDYATDQAGAVLEKVGAEDWADAVEDWGDETASSLGADVDEQQLGQTTEANELIHGNPVRIGSAAGNLRDFQRAFDAVGTGMRRLDSGSWRGEGADAFRERFAPLPGEWVRAADSFEGAAKALEAFAGTVTWAQERAREAVALYRRGEEASRDAVAAYNGRVDAYNAARGEPNPPARPEPFSDPGKGVRDRARQVLREARRQRDDAARTARGALTAALADAPEEPGGWERLRVDGMDHVVARGTELLHVAGGVVKGTAGLVSFVRGVNPLDPYNLAHPAEYYRKVNTTLAGLASTAANPDRALRNAWDAAKGDPSEFLGRLIPEIVGAKGAGLVKGAVRAGTRGYRDQPSPLPPLPDEWVTGARRRPRDLLDDPLQTRWAEAAYANFLENPRDIDSISEFTSHVERDNGSTGFSRDEISSVKRHVFETEHPIIDSETGEVHVRKFDADAEIADAWIRLRSGRAVPEDYVLLEHELAELSYLRDRPGSTYQEAHAYANTKYHWDSLVPLYVREDWEGEW